MPVELPFPQLTRRWTSLRPHEVQALYWKSEARFIVCPAGRRSGKTEIAKRKLLRKAMKHSKSWAGRYGFCAPTHRQAKKIYWPDLKAMVPPKLRWGSPSESELTIRLINGSEICVIGMDVPERVEGSPWDHLCLDEYANMKPRAWTDNIRPGLMDRGGGCMFIGVPEGRGHYYDLYCSAKADTSGEWAVFEWSARDILPAHEIASIERDLDPLTVQQEIDGKFVDFQGGAYHSFVRSVHVSEVTIPYDQTAALILMFDFNTAPGVCAIGQMGPSDQLLVIDEVHIPRNSNTPMVCDAIKNRYSMHKGPVRCYGDATGGARKTSSTEGSDWELVERAMRQTFGGRYVLRVKRANPTERARLNAVNSALHSRKVLVNKTCKWLIKDFEGVQLVEGGDGHIDKERDRTLTHISDAVGYFIEYEWPVHNRLVQTISIL